MVTMLDETIFFGVVVGAPGHERQSDAHNQGNGSEHPGCKRHVYPFGEFKKKRSGHENFFVVYPPIDK